jgi:hypothetical protein
MFSPPSWHPNHPSSYSHHNPLLFSKHSPPSSTTIFHHPLSSIIILPSTHCYPSAFPIIFFNVCHHLFQHSPLSFNYFHLKNISTHHPPSFLCHTPNILMSFSTYFKVQFINLNHCEIFKLK